MTKKKIGFVCFDMSTRGGAQQVLCNMANAMAGDYEIHVISMIHEKGQCAYVFDEGIRYTNILSGKKRIRDVVLHGGKGFRRYCQEQQLGMVFYVGAYAGLCGGILGRKLKIPRVFCDHGALLNQWKELPARLMRTLGSKYSERTVVLTKQSEQAYYDKFGYEPGRVLTIYNWIDPGICEHAKPYDATSRRILTAGRFSAEKGMDLLVDTAVELKKKTGDFIWEVYGDGDMFAQIQERLNEECLTEQVKLKGLTNQMEDCYGGHALYVLTSYREGLPLVLLEAKANHLPLVSFDIVSGPAEIIKDGTNGVLVPPYDTRRMAEVIYDLLSDDNLRLAMSEASVQGLESFQKEGILSQWKNLIDSLYE